jgi:uncharacterized phage protein (TIGR01671 family)
MRPIKFRAWDKENNQTMFGVGKYTGNFLIDFNGRVFDTDGKPHDNRFELMQFTGLLDKNGKEIYEGDIVTGMHYKRPRVVEWIINNGISGFIVVGINQNDTASFKGIEVIGNIYENPNLLEAQ